MEIAYTNYLTSSLNIFIGKTLVLSSSIPFTYLRIKSYTVIVVYL